MSRFTKHRKEIRLKEHEDNIRKEENSKKFDKTCNDIINTCKYIEEHQLEFDSLDGEERIKSFGKLFNKIHKKENI